jgi:geranylgeranyl pyrophosphate synthase
VNFRTILRPVHDDLSAVEAKLLDWSGTVAQEVAAELAQIIGAGGKRIRPACLLLCARLGADGGAARNRAQDLAVSVEIIHTASLIHDDIVDGASLRRGKPTLHMRRSVELALLVGDLLYSRVLRQLTEDARPETYRVMADTVYRMVTGELAETLKRDDVALSEEQYVNILNDKTGALFACACHLGGQVAGLDADDCARLRRYGESLGLAFQIVDDVLDVCEVERELGKPVGADIIEGTTTLPLIHALACDRDHIAALFRARNTKALRAEMLRHGSIVYALDRVRTAARDAVAALDTIAVNGGDGDAETCRRSLIALTEYVVGHGEAALEKMAPPSAAVG